MRGVPRLFFPKTIIARHSRFGHYDKLLDGRAKSSGNERTNERTYSLRTYIIVSADSGGADNKPPPSLDRARERKSDYRFNILEVRAHVRQICQDNLAGKSKHLRVNLTDLQDKLFLPLFASSIIVI